MTEFLPYALLTGWALFLLPFAGGLRDAAEGRIWTVASFGVALAAGLSLLSLGQAPGVLGTYLVHDPFGISFAAVLIGMLLFALPILPLSTPALREGALAVHPLLFLSTTGGLLMVFANHLLTFFVGLELLSLPLYVLTGLGGSSRRGTEAAFKYFLLGAVASALFAYGAALIWGGAGTLELPRLAQGIASSTQPTWTGLGLALVLGALAFKVGWAPFHMWLPDAYQGAPAAIVAWMSGAVKAATFAFAFRLVGAMAAGGFDVRSVLEPMLMASMIWGSLAALYQTDVKRMLAYSSIAHAGYMAIALVAPVKAAAQAESALLFYVLSYGLAGFTAFAVLSLEEREGKSEIQSLSGLARRKPVLAVAFSAALLSLAGMPPLAGFVAKFNVFSIAADEKAYPLLLVAVLTSLVSLAYYLRLIVAIYMEEASGLPVLRVRKAVQTALVVSAVAIVAFGLEPARLLGYVARVLAEGIP